MWVFFENGTFYSAVSDLKDPETLWVRSRDRRSAEIFADELGVEIQEWPGRDYAYRSEVTRSEWVSFVSLRADEARATNFKSEVTRNLGYKKGKKWLDALHDVWGVMFSLQHDLKRLEKKS